MGRIQVEVAVRAQCELGEGPVWDPRARRLHWVDIIGKRVHTFDPTDGTATRCDLPHMPTALALREDGGYLLATEHSLTEFDLKTGNTTPVADLPDYDSVGFRLNDGKCDPQGRFWVGSMPRQERPGAAALYCLAAGSPPRRVLDGVSLSNGLAWSRDGMTLYYIDSPSRQVDAFDFDPSTGALSRRRTVIRLTPGSDLPDGCTLDAEGMLWVAHWAGRKVTRWDPTSGNCLTTVEIPAPLVTSCTFGDEDLGTLYFTTARCDLTVGERSDYPDSGSLFRCRPGVSGLPAARFAG